MAGSECRVFVGGLGPKVDEGVLRDFFAPFGQVLECKIIYDRETGKSKGFGFIDFKEHESAIGAVDHFNDMEVRTEEGEAVNVELGKDREEKPEEDEDEEEEGAEKKKKQKDKDGEEDGEDAEKKNKKKEEEEEEGGEEDKKDKDAAEADGDVGPRSLPNKTLTSTPR